MAKRRAHRLGELERAVLERLWSDGPCDVKTMHLGLGVARGIAFNTVQTTLERLHRKGLAQRSRRGRAHVYEASLTRREWVALAIQELVESVPGLPADALVAAFVDVAARASAAHLEQLERLVRERRQAKERR